MLRLALAQTVSLRKPLMPSFLVSHPAGHCRAVQRLAVLGAVIMVANAEAQAPAQASLQNVVSLSASATAELPKDWLTVVFSTSREGTDATAVQGQLKQALEAALVEARKLAKPGQVELRTGAFSLYPRYTPKGSLNGWQGAVELAVEGRDVQAISQLTGRVTALSIARVGFSLSRQARDAAEAEVTGQAINLFRAKAEAVSKAFGFGGYSVRDVAVGADLPMQEAPMLRARAMAAPADAALPVEAGKATVVVSVTGSVQMSPR